MRQEASDVLLSNPAYRRLCIFVDDFPWIHMWLSVIGSLLFCAGSVLFLIGGAARTVGTVLFLAGSVGILSGSVGQLVKEHVARKLRT